MILNNISILIESANTRNDSVGSFLSNHKGIIALGAIPIAGKLAMPAYMSYMKKNNPNQYAKMNHKGTAIGIGMAAGVGTGLAAASEGSHKYTPSIYNVIHPAEEFIKKGIHNAIN